MQDNVLAATVPVTVQMQLPSLSMWDDDDGDGDGDDGCGDDDARALCLHNKHYACMTASYCKGVRCSDTFKVQSASLGSNDQVASRRPFDVMQT